MNKGLKEMKEEVEKMKEEVEKMKEELEEKKEEVEKMKEELWEAQQDIPYDYASSRDFEKLKDTVEGIMYEGRVTLERLDNVENDTCKMEEEVKICKDMFEDFNYNWFRNKIKWCEREIKKLQEK